MKKNILYALLITCMLGGCTSTQQNSPLNSVDVSEMESKTEIQFEFESEANPESKTSLTFKSEDALMTEETNFEYSIEIELTSDIDEKDITNKEIKYEELNGRGYSDSGREEPSYINVFGYVAIGYNEEHLLSHTDSYTETPWMVSTYEKDKQFYVENGAIEHKTEVVVREQELKHEGYGAYSGYLLVEKFDSDEQFYINVNNFITKPYWTYDDLKSAVTIGYCIAEYNQVSDYYPVNSSNKKVELNDATKVLLVGKTGLYGRNGPDNNVNSIETIVFKEWEYGYGGVNVFFNPQDLSILY